MPNHLQTVNLGFQGQPRNPRSSSPCVRCRPHTVPPELSIARPPSTQPVRPSSVLCTRSPTPATILVTGRHVAPAHHEISKHDSPNETKVKKKQNKTVMNSNSNLAKSMTHHNQIKELITWFLRFHACSYALNFSWGF
jgi:hypothetical protein